ncbi:GNAT family N-acetyltransferase [Marinobacterium maritimum]|uniref:GNAT family N-acetyltransferase n=1 Tax=Marinobacterium maritimum TaxID=500162 RepID=A0ABN1I383_9GAMM
METERLCLRQWRPEDREPFAVLNADPEVMRYFPGTLNRVESDALADRIEQLIDQQGWGFWAVEVKTSGDFVGFVGLNSPSPELPFSPCVEIGWRLSRHAWGKGYATEAAAAALAFGFDALELEHIVSFTALSNSRSWQLMERLGMERQPDSFMHPALPVGSPLREHCLYRLEAERWVSERAVKAQHKE